MALPPRAEKTILVTGASSGFGRATVRHLLMNGWRVFATVRSDDDREGLGAMADELVATSRLHVLRCDVTNANDVRELGAAVAAQTDRLGALLNNAGTAWAAPLELLHIADLRAQLEVNTVAPVAVTQAVLPLLKAAGGVVINVSSVSGRLAFPVLGPYCASKFALEAISDAWRVELAPFGVRVVLIEPASSSTRIWDTSEGRMRDVLAAHAGGPYARLFAAFTGVVQQGRTAGFSPQAFAVLVARILSARQPQTRYTIPRGVAVQLALSRVLPDRVLDGFIRRTLNW